MSSFREKTHLNAHSFCSFSTSLPSLLCLETSLDWSTLCIKESQVLMFQDDLCGWNNRLDKSTHQGCLIDDCSIQYNSIKTISVLLAEVVDGKPKSKSLLTIRILQLVCWSYWSFSDHRVLRSKVSLDINSPKNLSRSIVFIWLKVKGMLHGKRIVV